MAWSEWKLRTLKLVLLLVPICGGQFRNDQDPNYNPYRDYPGYPTQAPVRTRYNSGDTYYGTDRRYDTRYDDPQRTRGFDNLYESRYDQQGNGDRLWGANTGR